MVLSAHQGPKLAARNFELVSDLHTTHRTLRNTMVDGFNVHVDQLSLPEIGGRKMRRLFLSMGRVALLPLASFCAEQEKAAKDDKKTTTSAKPMIPVFNLSSGLSESPEEVSFSLGDMPVSLKDLVARM